MLIVKKVWMESFAARMLLYQAVVCVKAAMVPGAREGAFVTCFYNTLLGPRSGDQYWMVPYLNVICNRETRQSLVLGELLSLKARSSAVLSGLTCQCASVSVTLSFSLLFHGISKNDGKIMDRKCLLDCLE